MRWGDCKKNLSASTKFNFTNGTINKITVFGTFEIYKEMKDLELTLDVVRCAFNMKTCDRYPTPSAIEELCSKFEDKGAYYSILFDSIEPIFKCPVKVGTYKLNQLTFELPSFITYFPLDGYVWVTTFKFVDRKSRKIIGCLNSETKIVRKRIRD
jgi:hypothetical protein